MTKFVSKNEINNNWYEIDAKNAVIGRLAAVITKIIRGKNKTTFTPHMDNGDFVVVKNIEQAKFTGKKFLYKKYYRHTGYPGGIKVTTPEKLHEKKPGEVLKLAVKRMLPGGVLGKKQLTKLKIYKGEKIADIRVLSSKKLSTKYAMAIGTAGFTSMLCISALEKQGLKIGNGPVLVTGASGGVGSIAIAILSNLGYEVCASTGKIDEHEFLKSIGAAEILPREDLAGDAKAPLNSERWAGVVDTVGANTLANVLSQMKYGCSVAACGLAGGSKLDTTVIPFLLRGVNLLGVDSVVQPYDCLLYTSPSPRDLSTSRMPSSA